MSTSIGVWRRRCLVGVTWLLAGAGVEAAPLTWFPGPPVGSPFSGAATVAEASLGNILIGGDNLVDPEYLVATNLYWGYLPQFWGFQIAAGAVATSDYIIVYGGTDGTASLNTVTGYSPSGDGQTNLASMSVARSYLGYAADGSGNAFAIGGLDDTGLPLASAERYKSGATNWTAIAALPAPRYDFPAVYDRTNRIYIFGGITDATSGTELATVLRYSTKSNNWTAVASMPVPTAGSTAALGADGQIYVVGGVSGGVTTNVVQVYNLASNSWTISTPLPEALSAAAMGVDSLGRLMVMGGMNSDGNDVGDVWRSQRLGVPDVAPVLTQYPGTSAIYGQPYTATINASGNPQPTYQVLSGPPNLAVDVYSGAITWTPQGASQIGTIAVTIQAGNYAGATNFAFSISVPPPPPIVPTNLTVVGVSDDSITLSWAPESPLVGAATYNVAEWRFTGGGKGGSHGAFFAVSSGQTNATVTISGLTPGTGHSYGVAASVGGTVTAYSATVGATTTSPQPPANVHLTSLTSTSFSLAWNPSAGPAQSANYSAITSYAIGQYIPVYGGYSVTPKVAAIPSNITNGTVSGLTPGSSAFWTVQAFDAQGYGSSPISPIYDIIAITNPVPAAARMSAMPTSGGGSFQFSASEGGPVLQTVLIQATTNVADPNSWMQIGSLLPTANPFTYSDTNAAQYPLRFYRVIAP